MLTKEIEFYGYELTPSRFVRASAILRRMQQVAGEDVTQYGLGYDFLLSRGVVFVLSKLRFRLLRPLRSGETYFLTTHSRRIHGVTFVRDFTLEDQEGKNLLNCESLWCLLDFEKRTIARPNALPLEKMVYSSPETILETRRLFLPQEEKSASMRREVLPSLLDQNRHLNNCNYADLVLDILPREDSEIRDLQIDFKKEALLDETLLIERFPTEGGYFIAGSFENTGEKCFFARAETFGEENV